MSPSPESHPTRSGPSGLRPRAGLEAGRPTFLTLPVRGPTGFAMDQLMRESRRARRGPAGQYGGSQGRRCWLRSLMDVAMVQAADFGTLHDPACREDLDRLRSGRVLVRREMGTCQVVVGEVLGQDAAEVSLAEDEHVIQALAPDRARHPRRSSAAQVVVELPATLRHRRYSCITRCLLPRGPRGGSELTMDCFEHDAMMAHRL